MSKPKPIVKVAFVAEKIKEEIQNGMIGKNELLVERILFHDKNICTQLGIDKKYKSSTIDKSTLYRFLRKFDIPKTRKRNKKSKNNKSVDISDDDDDETAAPTENTMVGTEKKSSISPSSIETLFLEEEGGGNNHDKSIIIQYQGEKIRELAKICSGLSNKIPPSSMISASSSSANDHYNLDGGEIELEQNRALHLCIKAFIQVISPVKKITEWIIENDFLIISHQQVGGRNYPPDPFQQLANTWFWDGILKYESLEENADKVKILKRFGHNIKALCEKHDQVFGTTFTVGKNGNRAHGQQQLFIPPPPQKILEMIIQQHYNHFIDNLPNSKEVYDLPNLPFKKIELRPPSNTKPYDQVSFCSWRPREQYFFDGGGEDYDEKSPSQPEILFAELSFDREKLTYVHFEWPHYEEDVILEGEKFYTPPYQQKGACPQIHKHHPRFDYQMIGVIWGRQFAGDWAGIRQDGMLPHLGINNPPVTYIYATKRNTSSKNPKQGKWYVCLDDNYVSYFRPKELTNNFQDVLLYMDNNHRRTYRPQLLVFQKIVRTVPDEDSPTSIHQYEPSLHKNIISSVTAMNYQEPSSLLNCCSRTNCQNCTTTVEKKKKKSPSTTNKILLRPNAQLTSKKKLLEAIDMICNALPISYTAKNGGTADDVERFFSYDKASDYPKGLSGFQITQTHDQRRYYATRLNH
jgi:hypothetical protein